MASSDHPTPPASVPTPPNPAIQPTATEAEFQPAFEAELAEVQQALGALGDRFRQVQADRAEVTQLQARKAEIQQAQDRTAALKAELGQIQEKLRELEVNLECRLSLPWSGLKQAFWQAVRFGGLGFVLGWALAFAMMRSPQPRLTPQGNLPDQPPSSAPVNP